jgi:hypothetical protein
MIIYENGATTDMAPRETLVDVLDINQSQQLALVADLPGFKNPRYVTLTKKLREAFNADGSQWTPGYLRQFHYAARCATPGRIVSTDTASPGHGWELAK